MQSPAQPVSNSGGLHVYAVRKGRGGIKNVVVLTWAECAVLVKDGFGMQYHKFPKETEHSVIERYFTSGRDDRDEAAKLVLERNQYRPKQTNLSSSSYGLGVEQRPLHEGAATVQFPATTGGGMRVARQMTVPVSVGPSNHRTLTQED